MADTPINPAHAEDHSLLHQLRNFRRSTRKLTPAPAPTGPSFGAKLADAVAATMGSWGFIIVQTCLLATWIVANVAGWVTFDPYPFILLNLMLSFQAAYAAPFIMMSQNRQSDIDRARAIDDYNINLKAELEIELLHQKVDMMREQEIARLQRIIEELVLRIDKATPGPG